MSDTKQLDTQPEIEARLLNMSEHDELVML